MNVLVVGSGAREHALAWKLAQSPRVGSILAAPGNAGIGELAECIPIAAADVTAVADLAERRSVDLTVVGPEAPLVAGLADELQRRGLPVFGPTAAGARIEGSKAWARDLCDRHGIPGARCRAFTDLGNAAAALDEFGPPWVVKADGLAAGKGVTVTENRGEAEAALRAALVEGAFGEAGDRVLLEECLVGPEVSALALTDGESVLPLIPSQDYKRAHDGDLGPNTGGMGAYSPVPIVDPPLWDRITREILEPTVAAMRAEGTSYRGMLYAGVMLTSDGPRVLEFNCRFGDPETEAILPLLEGDLAEILMACAEGRLDRSSVSWLPGGCVTVVLASGGYPDGYATGLPIDGLDRAAALPGVFPFHAGTSTGDGRVQTSGGRVLAVSARGPSIRAARERAYEAADLVRFEGKQHRRDIAADVGERAIG